jgi:hypothetical protein
VFLVLSFFVGGEPGQVGGARQVTIRTSNSQGHGAVGAEVCAALALGRDRLEASVGIWRRRLERGRCSGHGYS